MGAKSFWEMGQLILSMGLVKMEVCILAQRTTTLSKGFFSNITTHVLPCIVYVVNMLSCAVHIYSPLQVKNKPRDGDSKHVFILGPASLVANSIFLTLEPSDLEIQHSPASHKKQCRAELNLEPFE